MEIFFNEPKGNPDNDDLSVGDNDREIAISCVFDDLPRELVIDATHPTTLNDEYMLNPDGLLEIKKAFRIDGNIRKQVYAVADHPTATNFNDLLTLNRQDLQSRARDLGVDLSNVNQSINTQLRRAIWGSQANLRIERSVIDLSSETAKAIWEKLKPCLPVFALFKSDRPSTDQDAEAQDPMKAAVREAIARQEETLNQIAEQVEQEVQQIADKTVAKIREMNPELSRNAK